ncbi:MAG: AraC family transcriptional regulator [Ruminococcaceae bacterium]|nr:AraC family transcriptional regulator [Oscillospiraceae bacterium]
MGYNELKQHGTEDFPIELYHIDKTHTRYEMAAHWHSEFEIIRVLEGVLNVRLNNNSYTVTKNETVFVNSETLHQAYPEDCVYECIVFRLDMIHSLNIDSTFFIDCVRNRELIIDEYHADRYPSITAAVKELFETMATDSAGSKLKILGALLKLFGEIADINWYHSGDNVSLTTEKNMLKLKTVLSFMRSHYDVPISLEEMAYAAGMSSKYFCHFFKEMTTKTPVEYLNLYRIEKASGKLIRTEMSVTEIALSCGFNDLSYFIKTFKQIKGSTPAQYRRRALQ